MGDVMHHRHTLAAVAAGVLSIAGIGATIPADATTTPSRSTTAQATALVVNARWGGHATFDRLVIDLRGAVPSVTVRQVPALHQDGSGQKVPLAGKYFLEIRLSPPPPTTTPGGPSTRGPVC